jgi:hypothetical protein
MWGQMKANLSSEQKDLLQRAWHESPRENSGDTIAFRQMKHIHTPGKDDPSFIFARIEFQALPDVNVEGWRWCSKNTLVYSGKWTLVSGPLVKLDFGAKQKCRCQLQLVELTKDRLRMVIKEM